MDMHSHIICSGVPVITTTSGFAHRLASGVTGCPSALLRAAAWGAPPPYGRRLPGVLICGTARISRLSPLRGHAGRRWTCRRGTVGNTADVGHEDVFVPRRAAIMACRRAGSGGMGIAGQSSSLSMRAHGHRLPTQAQLVHDDALPFGVLLVQLAPDRLGAVRAAKGRTTASPVALPLQKSARCGKGRSSIVGKSTPRSPRYAPRTVPVRVGLSTRTGRTTRDAEPALPHTLSQGRSRLVVV